MRILIIIFALSGCTTPLGKLALDTGYEGTAGGLIDAGVDVDVDGGPPEANPGDDCTDGGVLDCDLECWVADARAYMGDGTCDAGQRGPDFDCELTGFDAGDCSTGSDIDAGPAPTDGGSDADESGTDADDGSDDGAVDDGAADDGVSPDESAPEPDADADGGAATDPGTDDDGGVVAPGDDDTEPDAGSVGSACEDEYGDIGILDCSLLCVPTEIFVEWHGDGTCDDGSYGVYFDCIDLDWDAGDCASGESDGGDWSPDEGAMIGYECTTLDGYYGYYDCMLQCVPEDYYLGLFSWWGDGTCDDGSYGVYFDCAELEWDLGDCPVGETSSDDEVAPTSLVGMACDVVTEGGIFVGEGTYDCSENCKYGDISDDVGDGICDDGTGTTGTHVDLVCEYFELDGYDCF
jgi:hypothetical protein